MLNLSKNSDKKELYKKIINEKNYGLTEIQIIFITNKIIKLHNHCILNKKDFHNKRGLILHISKRKKLLNYLRKKNLCRYNNIASFLGLKTF